MTAGWIRGFALKSTDGIFTTCEKFTLDCLIFSREQRQRRLFEPGDQPSLSDVQFFLKSISKRRLCV